VDRRSFLALSAALAVGARRALGDDAPPTERLPLGVPLTHSDWMLHPNVAWGDEGVRHMLDACKACGWSRVYWRAFDGGRSLYQSKLLRPQGKWDDDSYWNPQTEADRRLVERYSPGMTPAARADLRRRIEAHDYSEFDTLASAVAYGHQIGLQIHAWVTVNEDDHGWGLQSEFSKKHPEFRWVRRDGRSFRSQLSFAFPEVRAYKLALIRELLDGYDIDGLFVDWIRTGDVRDNPQTDAAGVADSGYEQPGVEKFKADFGVDPHDVPNGDPRWVRTRALPQTQFMRDLRKLAAARPRKTPVAVLVGHPWHYRGTNDPIDGNPRGLLLDVTAWANEGLIDAAVAAGYYRPGGSAESAYRALRAETGGKVDVWTYAWVPTTVAGFEGDFAVAQKLGAKQMLLWEADYIDARANATELKLAMKRRAAE